MKKMLFLVLVSFFVLALAAPALATSTPVPIGPPADGYTPRSSDDTDAPDLTDADCLLCHGEVENGFDPWIAEEDTNAQVSTLRNIVRFHNLFALQAMKVEDSTGTSGTPILDIGNGSPINPARGHFWTYIASNAPYYERYSWSGFSGFAYDGRPFGFSGMSVKVWDDGASTPWMSSAFNHPTNPGPSPPSHNDIVTNWKPQNWEKVELRVKPPWAVYPGTYQSTLTIVVTQL